MFLTLGDGDDAATTRHEADLTAASVIANWNKDEGYLPAVFDGKTTARILPMVEGLAYPYEMGLTKETAPDGPYADLMKVLHNHVDNALQPGICLDSVTGAWKLSSSSQNTWQSKVYLAQFVVENILGIKDDRLTGRWIKFMRASRFAEPPRKPGPTSLTARAAKSLEARTILAASPVPFGGWTPRTPGRARTRR